MAVSFQRMPTLSFVLLLYEKLILMVNDMRVFYPGLSKGIDAGLDKLKQYLGKSRKVKIYTLAMGS